MQVQVFDKMPKAAVDIRREVFMQEQGFEREFDKVDEIATHFLAVDEFGVAQATCRVYYNVEKSTFVLGRFAVKKENRGKNIGRLMVDSVANFVQEKGAKELQVFAQCRATPFYQKVGFVAYGEQGDDEGIPHIWMRKVL